MESSVLEECDVSIFRIEEITDFFTLMYYTDGTTAILPEDMY